MAKMMGQDEIDAMFANARASAEQSPSQAAPTYEVYNFGRGGNISNEQMRAIATVNDLFARNLMQSAGAWLRTEYNVTMVSGEQMEYTEFVERLTEGTYICSIRLEPLGAMGLIEVELSIVAPMVDLLLGGKGRPEPPRPLTEIEELIMVSVVQVMVKELNAAWAPVGLQFAFERRESTAQVARMMPAGEKTLCVSFEVKMPKVQGALNLCLPAVVLNTILRRLISGRDRPRRIADEVQARMRDLLAQAKLGAVLQFPPMRMQARQIASLELGSVLRLPRPRHAPAELRVGGLAMGAAWPVRTGEHRGARLEEMTRSPATSDVIPSVRAGS
jgi:flagellar motor switch protein FliM